MAGLVVKSIAVILINFSAKLNICVPKSATSQSPETLPAMLGRQFITTQIDGLTN